MDVTERVIAIISLLTRHKELHSLTGISRELGISKSTAHRIMSSLERLQWVVRDKRTRKYCLGPGALEIGLSVLSNIDIRNISLPYLYQLHDTTNESAMLSLRIGLERVYIEQVESSSELLMKAELGKRYPLWCGAQGKAMLTGRKGLKYLGANRLVKYAENWSGDLGVHLKETQEARRIGLSLLEFYTEEVA